MLFTADFETTTNPKDCRVWAYGLCEIGNPSNFIYGNNIDDFMYYLEHHKKNLKLWFHNARFDCTFIMYWLFRNGFKHVEDRKDLKNKTFITLISDKGQFYSMKIVFKKSGHKTKYVEIFDSLKLLSFSVKQIAKDFKLPIQKLKLGSHPIRNKKFMMFSYDILQYFKGRKRIKKYDIKLLQLGYKGFRKKGHIISEHELKYLTNDCEVMSRALDYMMNVLGMTKMTVGSNALAEYKDVIGKYKFQDYFPILDFEIDKVVRQSYKGGWTYLDSRFANKIIDGGIVLDVNALYPSRMYDCLLPYGRPLYFKGKYKKDDLYNLYVQVFECQFELKKDHLPIVQIKNNLGSFIPTQYLKDSAGECPRLCMTNIDFTLFKEQYDVYNIEYFGGYKFKSSNIFFKEYIDKWNGNKMKAKDEENGAMYVTSKLMLNNIYGKFALNPKVRSKIPCYDKKEDKLHYSYGEEEIRDPIYIPMGTFITSYARDKTIRAAQAVYPRFMYADTDSLHLKGYDIPEELKDQIDSKKLGWWDHEFTFDKAKYLRQKTYMERGHNPSKPNQEIYTKITCAGMPSACYGQVNFENFAIGSKFKGKLTPMNVSGGIVLEDTLFTIKNFKVL